MCTAWIHLAICIPCFVNFLRNYQCILCLVESIKFLTNKNDDDDDDNNNNFYYCWNMVVLLAAALMTYLGMINTSCGT